MAIYESQKIRDYSEKKSSPFSELLNLVETFSSINKQEQAQTMSSLEKKLQKRLDNVSKQTGKKYKKVKLQRFEPEDFIQTA